MADYVNMCEQMGGIATTNTTGTKKGTTETNLKTVITLTGEGWSVGCDKNNDGKYEDYTEGEYIPGWEDLFQYAHDACEAAGGTPTTTGGEGPNIETATAGQN